MPHASRAAVGLDPMEKNEVTEQHEFKIDAGNKFMMALSLLALIAAVAFLVYHLTQFLGQQLAMGGLDTGAETTETVAQRMTPVGRVETAAIDRSAAAAPAEPRAATDVYRSVCAACHDAGVAGAPRLTDLDEWAKRLDEKGLDTLVSHSINGFQGMPARGGNPSLTDAEVAATVAYMLQEAGLEIDAAPADEATAVADATPAETADATPAETTDAAPVETASAGIQGDRVAGEQKYVTCITCHGPEGEGMGIFPKIAGQTADYIAGRLQQYRAGEMVGPNSPLMMPHASALSDEDINNLAVFIAAIGMPEEAEAETSAEDTAAAEDTPAAEDTAAAPAGNPERGQTLYATCTTCHGPAGAGMGIFPKIAGQSAEYLIGRLQQYRAGEMVGPNSPLMMPHATALSDEDIADLTAFIVQFPE